MLHQTLFSKLRDIPRDNIKMRWKSLAQRAVILSKNKTSGLYLKERYLSERLKFRIEGEEHHLYREYLDEKIAQWEKIQPRPDFISWLENLIAENPKNLQEAKANRVHYFNDAELRAYKVENFVEGGKPVIPGVDDFFGEYNFVRTLNDELYIYPDKTSEGLRLHHSSCNGSLNVKNAGRFSFRGVHFVLDNMSGHYMPSKENFIEFLNWLAKRSDIDISQFRVTIYDGSVFDIYGSVFDPASKYLQETKMISEPAESPQRPLKILMSFDSLEFNGLSRDEQRSYLLERMRCSNFFLRPFAVAKNYHFIKLLIQRDEKNDSITLPICLPKDNMTLEMMGKIVCALYGVEVFRYIFCGSRVQNLSECQTTKDDSLFVIAKRLNPIMREVPEEVPIISPAYIP